MKSVAAATRAILASTVSAFAPNFNDVTTLPGIVAPTGFFDPLALPKG